jgi:hypothetical protein
VVAQLVEFDDAVGARDEVAAVKLFPVADLRAGHAADHVAADAVALADVDGEHGPEVLFFQIVVGDADKIRIAVNLTAGWVLDRAAEGRLASEGRVAA